MRAVLLTAEPGDLARGSGTAMAVAGVRSALAAHDVSVPVLRPSSTRGGQTLARRRFNRSLNARLLDGYDAVLGINGDGWEVASRLRVPYVVLVKALYAGALEHEHGLVRGMLRLHARWEGAGARAADRVVVPSRFAGRAVAERYRVDPALIRLVPEPFDLDAWRRALPARQRTARRVLCVAHLYPRKRVADLVRAWPAVVRAAPGARLDIVGGGPELGHLARQARSVPACFLHGHIGHPQILELYARADVFALPSAQETFGYAAVEAMASGLPVVCADAGALPELCDGAVGVCVPVGDTDALAQAIVHHLGDPSLRSQAAARNPQRAAVFSPPDVGRALLRVIEEVRGDGQRRNGGSDSRSAASSR